MNTTAVAKAIHTVNHTDSPPASTTAIAMLSESILAIHSFSPKSHTSEIKSHPEHYRSEERQSSAMPPDTLLFSKRSGSW